MTKQEFLQILRGRIAGRMNPAEVNDQISYYDSYIDQLIDSGKTEEEVVEELGDPLLIAKTLGKAVDGGYLDKDYMYDASSSSGGASSSGGSSYSGASSSGGSSYSSYSSSGQSSYSGYTSTGGTSYSDNLYSTGYQNSYSRSAEEQGVPGGRWDWLKHNGKAIAVLVVALIVAIGCIVLFFVACFHVGGCVLGGLFPIIIAVVIIGMLYSVLRK